jgi:type IV pilus assembly protein PilX
MNSATIFLLRSPQQRGFVLAACLLMLLMMMILTVSMSKSGGMRELITGSHREKIKAFESAQAAMNYAEWWLNQGNATGLNVGTTTNTANCSATTAAPVVCNCSTISTTPAVCFNALASPTTLPWTAGIQYTPPNMTISTTGGVGSYYAIPLYYIQYIGISPNTGKNMYQITATGQGGDAGSIAVLQSVFSF